MDGLGWRLDFAHRRDDLRDDPSRPLWLRQAEIIGRELRRRGIRPGG